MVYTIWHTRTKKMVEMHWREEKIAQFLEKSGKQKTGDIIKNTDMCKVTALKYLSKLRGKKVIDYEMVGPTKLWYLTRENKRKKTEKQKKVFELLQDFEEITGVKADMIITSKGVALALGGSKFDAI